MVKPAGQGSALGIKFARTPADVPAALVAAFSYDRKVLLERHVVGRDLAVSVLDEDGIPRPLPIVEAVPEQEDFYDFESRYEIGRTRFVCPAALDDAVAARASELALEVYALLGCSGFARIDLMLETRHGCALRARGQRDPGPDRDEPVAAGRRRRRDRLRRLGGADPATGAGAMRAETQREILTAVLRAARRAHDELAPEPMRQRSSVYTDPARLAAEEQALFRGRALMVGMSADLPATGDIVTTEVAGVPLLLIRGEDAACARF